MMTNDERVVYIIEFEQGTLSNDDTIRLMSDLAVTKIGYSLQGSYGRYIDALKDDGYLNDDGTIKRFIGEE